MGLLVSSVENGTGTRCPSRLENFASSVSGQPMLGNSSRSSTTASAACSSSQPMKGSNQATVTLQEVTPASNGATSTSLQLEGTSCMSSPIKKVITCTSLFCSCMLSLSFLQLRQVGHRIPWGARGGSVGARGWLVGARGEPSDRPTIRPTVRPSHRPTVRPSVCPSFRPTVRSTDHPTVRR